MSWTEKKSSAEVLFRRNDFEKAMEGYAAAAEAATEQNAGALQDQEDDKWLVIMLHPDFPALCWRPLLLEHEVPTQSQRALMHCTHRASEDRVDNKLVNIFSSFYHPPDPEIHLQHHEMLQSATQTHVRWRGELS
jgi:hypothetical protein